MKSPLKKSIGEVVTDYGARVMKVFKKGLLQRSLFDFYGDVKADKLRVKESSSVPATPIDGDGGVMYTKSADGKLYYKSNEVAEVELSAADTVLTSEQVQDIVGAMVDGGTETNIAVTYDDTGGKLNFVSTNTTYSEATGSAEGLMSTAHHDKLDGIEDNATADQTQADINGLGITAIGIASATDSDVTITSDGEVTVKLDSDNDESNQKFKITNNADSVVFSIQEDGIVNMAGGTINIDGSNSNFELNSGSDIVLGADVAGGTTSTIQYLDSGSDNRVMLAAYATDIVVLSNRASNGTVQIRANTSTAGSGGEVTVATFTDTEVTFSKPLVGNRKFTKTDAGTHFEAQGDILYFGSGSTTQGDLCYLKEDGSWGQADADGAATGDDADRDAMGMLAIALSTIPLNDGMLIKGVITMDYDLGDVGNPIYVKVTAGGMSHVAPSASGDFVRVVGYCLDDDHGIIYFNPDNTWVEIA